MFVCNDAICLMLIQFEDSFQTELKMFSYFGSDDDVLCFITLETFTDCVKLK